MTVYVKDLVDNLRIECVYSTEELLQKQITTADITRPGLEMTGYFDYYAPERIQLIGMKEWSYLMAMTAHNRYQVLSQMFQPETPVVIVARGLEIPEEMYKAAKKNKLLSAEARQQPVVYRENCLLTWIVAWLSGRVYTVS